MSLADIHQAVARSRHFGALGDNRARVFAVSRSASELNSLAAPPIRHAAAVASVTVVQGRQKNLRLIWNASAICTVGVPVAETKSHFRKRNLFVEVTNFGGATDRLLEAIATDKADAGVGLRGLDTNW